MHILGNTLYSCRHILCLYFQESWNIKNHDISFLSTIFRSLGLLHVFEGWSSFVLCYCLALCNAVFCWKAIYRFKLSRYIILIWFIDMHHGCILQMSLAQIVAERIEGNVEHWIAYQSNNQWIFKMLGNFWRTHEQKRHPHFIAHLLWWCFRITDLLK